MCKVAIQPQIPGQVAVAIKGETYREKEHKLTSHTSGNDFPSSQAVQWKETLVYPSHVW